MKVAQRRELMFSAGTRDYELDALLASHHQLYNTSAFFLMKGMYDDAHSVCRSVWGAELQLSPHMASRFYFEGHQLPGDGHGWHAEKSTVTAFLSLTDADDPLLVIPAGANKGKHPNPDLALSFQMNAGDLVVVAGRYLWLSFPKLGASRGRYVLAMNFHAENDMGRLSGFDDSLFFKK